MCALLQRNDRGATFTGIAPGRPLPPKVNRPAYRTCNPTPYAVVSFWMKQLDNAGLKPNVPPESQMKAASKLLKEYPVEDICRVIYDLAVWAIQSRRVFSLKAVEKKLRGNQPS